MIPFTESKFGNISLIIKEIDQYIISSSISSSHILMFKVNSISKSLNRRCSFNDIFLLVLKHLHVLLSHLQLQSSVMLSLESSF